ncbi:MAG: divalent-cation tolerance protein CutA [Balneolales bacterium]|nr:divalent-cation tolerance protein CutA [Balneolales bacterium]
MENHDKPIFVYITCPTVEEARSLAGALLVHRLIACANILPKMESVYRWNGKIKHEAEVVLLLKTRESRLPAIKEKTNELHSHDLPCIIAIPISGGNQSYLDWITSEIEGQTPVPEIPLD